VSFTIKDRILDAIMRYGEKAYIVLKTALELSNENDNAMVGDFNYRDLIERLKIKGIKYNPSNMLKILEKEYGIIETTYKSERHHWWKFIDKNAVEEALSDYVNTNTKQVHHIDLDLKLIEIQLNSLELDRLRDILNYLAKKPYLTENDLWTFRRIVFNELELIVKLHKKLIAYEHNFKDEIRLIEHIIELASLVSRKINNSENKVKDFATITVTRELKYNLQML